MRKIDLDYRIRKPWLGRVLLGAGLISAAAMTTAYLVLMDEAGQWQAVTEQAAQPVKSKRTPSSAGDSLRVQQEIDQANDVIRRISLPWNDLLKALEDSAIDTVALISIQPDPQQGAVSLNGEARTYADVLTYVLRLDSSGTLTRARLLNHEIRRDDPQHPVAFNATARWKVTP